MSHIDSELIMLRKRIAALEEQKQKEAEMASDKKEIPLKTLEELVDYYGALVPGKDQHQAEKWRKSREKLIFLKPILHVLKDIHGRLEILERR